MAAEPKTPVVLPKNVAGKAKSATPFTGRDAGSTFQNPYRYYSPEDISTTQSRGVVIDILRIMAQKDALSAASVNSVISLVTANGYKVKAMEVNSQRYSAEGTRLAQSVIARLNTLYDYTKKFSNKSSLSGLVEVFAKDLLLTGAIGAELVLDEARLPDRIQSIDYKTVTWVANGQNGRYAVQKGAGEGNKDVELNVATVWFEEMQKDSSQAYAYPFLESGLASLVHYQEFVEDSRRSLKKSGHGRLLATLLADKVRASAPEDIQTDPIKLAAYMEEVKDGVEDALSGLEPEDSLVAYDSVEFKPTKPATAPGDYTPLLSALGNVAATGLKTPSSVLGLRLEGSQSLSNTESIVFTKLVKSIQEPINRLLSRALTLAVRLYGTDVYVQVQLCEPTLRTSEEASAYLTMRQDRILKQLSLGMISDEEAAWELDITLPDGYVPLSGTGFMENTAIPTSTDVAGNQDGMGRAMKNAGKTAAGGASK